MIISSVSILLVNGTPSVDIDIAAVVVVAVEPEVPGIVDGVKGNEFERRVRIGGSGSGSGSGV